MDKIENLRKRAEAQWDIPVGKELITFLYGRFQERYPEWADDEDQFLSDCKGYGQVIVEFAGECGPPALARSRGKRGPYTKCLLEALALVSFVGRWRITQLPTARLPIQRLTKQWNREHRAHNKTASAFKGLYYHRRKECIRTVLEWQIAWIESQHLPMLSAELFRSVLREPDAFDADFAFTSELASGGLLLRVGPKDPRNTRLPDFISQPCDCPQPRFVQKNKDTGLWECGTCRKAEDVPSGRGGGQGHAPP